MYKKFLKRKEVKIIILLALVLTLLSLIIKEEPPSCGNLIICPATGEAWEDRGWPLPFIAGIVYPEFNIILFLIDFLFYLFIACIGWMIIKIINKPR